MQMSEHEFFDLLGGNDPTISAECLRADVRDLLALKRFIRTDNLFLFGNYCHMSNRVDARWYCRVLRNVLIHTVCLGNRIFEYLLNEMGSNIDQPADGRGSLLVTALIQCDARFNRHRYRRIQLIMKRGASPLYRTLDMDVYDYSFTRYRRNTLFGTPYHEGWRVSPAARLCLSWKSNGLKHLARAAFRSHVKREYLGTGDCCGGQIACDFVDLYIKIENDALFQLPETLLEFALNDPKIVSKVRAVCCMSCTDKRWMLLSSYYNGKLTARRACRDGVKCKHRRQV